MNTNDSVLVSTENKKDFPVTSGMSRPNLINTSLMGFIPADENSDLEIFQEPWYDPLDSKITGMLDSSRTVKTHRYSGEAITTISYKHYGTTSLWYAILMFNGFSHVDEIPRGYDIKIPEVANSQAAKSFIQKSRKGQVTSI